MSDQIGKTKPVESFEYELLEVDADNLRTVVATPTPAGPWIDPASVQLKYRIGRGPFGDVRLATHHQSSNDFEKYHELALKVLHPLEKNHTRKFLDKFEDVFSKSRGFHNVCWLYGVSIIDEKICIAMKIYDGSVGDKVARLKGGKLELSESLKSGIEISKGILELHSIGVLALNLKPSNILLNENNVAVLGDFGIPYLLLGMSLSNSDMVLRLGTPNYMAPEQWEAEVRGPICPETDSWGFGCCFVEMVTGVQPWEGKSTEEIYNSVVINQEKPQVPSGLPQAVECVINGCFEYDLRNRPLPADILNAFESSKNVIHSVAEWLNSRTVIKAGKVSIGCYSKWYLSKDKIQVGDTVRSRKPPNKIKSQTMDVPEGTVVSLESNNPEKDNFVLVQIVGARNPVRVLASTIERVTAGFAAGDWVSLKNNSASKHARVGILHSVSRDGSVEVGLIGLETPWKGNISDLQMANGYCIGQFVRIKETVRSPRFEWSRKSTGKISRILPNGCLVVGFPGRFVLGDDPNIFLADPSEVELVSFETCRGVVQKYRHVEDFHWAVRPIAIALGLFAGLKMTFFVGSRMKKGRRGLVPREEEGHSGNWLLPPVANLFKDV